MTLVAPSTGAETDGGVWKMADALPPEVTSLPEVVNHVGGPRVVVEIELDVSGRKYENSSSQGMMAQLTE